MSRRRWIYPTNGEPFEVSADFQPEPSGVLIVPDLPGYQSPVTGLWVEGRRARREDLKRTGSRPWEGMESEKREASRQEQYREQQVDRSLTQAASEAFYQLPPSKRNVLKGMA